MKCISVTAAAVAAALLPIAKQRELGSDGPRIRSCRKQVRTGRKIGKLSGVETRPRHVDQVATDQRISDAPRSGLIGLGQQRWTARDPGRQKRSCAQHFSPGDSVLHVH